MKQLQALAGGLDWFGSGSRVIITTRDKHLLKSHEIEQTYALKGLNEKESLELLKGMAFKNSEVHSGYEDVLNRTITYASGLPLAIEIIGRNFIGKFIEEWECTLEGYEKIPNKEIQNILKVSFDGLEEEQQSVFLDIACFFKGCYWEKVEHILNAHYGHNVKHHIGVLAEKSLIKITGCMSGYIRYITLHDLIEDMGKEIVRQESPKEPGKRSRLWCLDDIDVLIEKTGTSEIETILLNVPSNKGITDWKGKAFKKMTKLKTLIIKRGNFLRDSRHFPNSLRVFEWERCPLPCMPFIFLNTKFENLSPNFGAIRAVE